MFSLKDGVTGLADVLAVLKVLIDEHFVFTSVIHQKQNAVQVYILLGCACIIAVRWYHFQEKSITIVHIESRKSRKHVGEFEIFVDMECGSNMAVSDVLYELKRRVTGVILHDGSGRPSLAARKTISLDRGDTMCKSVFTSYSGAQGQGSGFHVTVCCG